MRQNHLSLGAGYLLDGIQLILQPGMRRFVVAPVLINIVIFIALTSTAVGYFNAATANISELLPQWQWLGPMIKAFATAIWLAFALLAVVLYGYSFSVITNILAAPFYGILAERIETRVTGVAPPPEPIISMIGRVILRELVKLWYFISRGLVVFIGCFILSFVPLANFFVPILLAIWSAWCLAIQYADYAADNNRAPFNRVKQALGDTRYSAWGLGGLTLLGTMVPLLNILAPPAAVAGGTLYWLKELAPNLRYN